MKDVLLPLMVSLYAYFVFYILTCILCCQPKDHEIPSEEYLKFAKRKQRKFKEEISRLEEKVRFCENLHYLKMWN